MMNTRSRGIPGAHLWSALFLLFVFVHGPSIAQCDMRITYEPDSLAALPSIAWNGEEYAIVWQENRDGDAFWELWLGRLDAFGNRISPDVRLTHAEGTAQRARVVWSGTEYGVVWEDWRHADELSRGREIYFARFDVFGNRIGPEVRITDHTGTIYNGVKPDLAWTGTEYGIAWEDGRQAPQGLRGEVFFARVDASGNKIGPDARVTNGSTGNTGNVFLIWTGSEYAASFVDDTTGDIEVYFKRIDSGGAPIGSDVRTTFAPGESNWPALAWSGTEFGVAWRDNRDGTHEVYFARLDAAGNKIGSDIRVTNGATVVFFHERHRAPLIWNGNRYAVAWTDAQNTDYQHEDIYFAQLDPEGNRIGTDVRLIDHDWDSWGPDLAWTGSEYGVAWYDHKDSPTFEIYFARPLTCPGADSDGDGIADVDDNCPDVANPEQDDTDLDGLGDFCDVDDDGDGAPDDQDNCPVNANPDQYDLDQDGLGDACDADPDGDGIGDDAGEVDNCPMIPNAYQDDTDLDGKGDACDDDDDNDGICDTDVEVPTCAPGPDNCPTVPNVGQQDLDGDGLGDACDADIDGDGIQNGLDNCLADPNPAQDDTDLDGAGDACDEDDDGDGVPDFADNCVSVANSDQTDSDSDGLGDACDGDLDGDGIDNDADNCALVSNPGQTDSDADGLGDACDTDVDGDGVPNATDLCAGTPSGELVDPSSGCSMAQLCPCDGPRGSTVPWKNHGRYVSCVAHAANCFVDQGVITEVEKGALISAAAQSDCGMD